MKNNIKNVMSAFILVTCMISSLDAQELNRPLINEIHKALVDCSYFEVTEEMFKALSEDPKFQDTKFKDQMDQIRFLIFVECPTHQPTFISDFMDNANLKRFKVMMRSKESNEQLNFLRKTNGEEKEYLLLHNRGLTYLVTSLNISTLQELHGYIQMVAKLGKS